MKPTVGLPAQLNRLLAQVQLSAKGFDLLQQAIDQLLRTTNWQSGYVVYGFVGVKFHALPARRRKRIKHVRFDTQ
jgi:hypothetical protein